MKTKQTKEELDKSIDEDTVIEPKTCARKKASDINEDDKKTTPDEPKTSKETKKPVGKPIAVVKKRPLDIRKTLRSKKAIVVKEKVKNVIKQTAKRGRKPALKVINTEETQNKKTVPLIPASEIKEPGLDTTPNSRTSSPRTAERRQRLGSDLAMKTILGDSPGNLVLDPHTSPYSMCSERSNSPSLFEGKTLRSGKPRKVNNLPSEVVIKEQKKRRRLPSDSKTSDTAGTPENCKNLKRERSCSCDGSEISKCSDKIESDSSMSETLNDTDSKEFTKNLDKSKTDLDIDIENNVQISTIEKVPSLVVEYKLAEIKLEPSEPSSNIHAKNKKMSLNRSSSLDSDNDNSNMINLDDFYSNEIEEKITMKTDNMLFDACSSILTSMSKTFNSKEMSKNIRKARRGRKVMAASQPVAPSPGPAPAPAPVLASSAPKNCITSTITGDAADDKIETIDTLSKEINDFINDLDENNDGDLEMVSQTNTTVTRDSTLDQMQTNTASKFYGLAKPLNNGDNVPISEMLVKDKDIEEKMIIKTDNTLFDARSSILISMFKTFNSKEMSTNIRKARRGRKVMAASRPLVPSLGPAPAPAPVLASSTPKNCIISTITADAADDKVETIDTLTKEINDLINDLDQNIDGDLEMVSQTNTTVTTDSTPDQVQTETASKFYGLAKPLNNGDKVWTPETSVKD